MGFPRQNYWKVKSLSHVRLFATPRTVAYQAPPSMGFSRQEYWSGLPFPSPGDLPNPGIEPRSPTLEADALTSEPPGKPKLLEWVAIFWDRNQIRISCIAGEPPGKPLRESNAQLFNTVSQNQFYASIISVFLNRENLACPCRYSGWTGNSFWPWECCFSVSCF